MGTLVEIHLNRCLQWFACQSAAASIAGRSRSRRKLLLNCGTGGRTCGRA